MSKEKMKKHLDKVVIITGGARGLGRVIALDFAMQGAKIVIADLRESDMETTASEIKALGVEVLTLTIDLSTKENCVRMISDVEDHFGRIDVLINNAGIVFCMDVLNNTDEQIQKTIDVNLMAQIWATRAVLPAMIARKSGTIISIASAAGKIGSPGISIYCSSKFGLIGFFDSLRHELRKSETNVRVIVVCPGFIDTKMFSGVKPPLFNSLADPKKISKALMKGIDKGKEEIFSPKITALLPFFRGIYSPRLMEKSMEFVKLHESFYSSKIVD